MRAIDADRLQKQFDKKSTNPNYRVNMHNIKSIISNAPTVEAIPKADMVAMLEELKAEIEELEPPSTDDYEDEETVGIRCGLIRAEKHIQDKINTLEEKE